MSFPRIDGVERVSGRAQYTDDIRKSDMLYARIIPANFPHAKVRRVDITEAMKLDGVSAILTSDDAEVKWPSGDRVNQRLVFTDHVRFRGDCVGAVAAISREVCEKAVSLVNIDYDELDASFTVESALGQTTPLIWPNAKSQSVYTYEIGNADDALAKSDLVLENTYVTNRHHNSPLEPAVSLAWWERDHLTVAAATQGITRCRQELAEALGVSADKVRVVSKFKGGGFGNKNSAMNYDIIAALLARKTGKPVRLEYSRMEDFVCVHGRWGSRQHVRAGFTKYGKFLAYALEDVCDIGAYGRHPGGQYVSGPQELYNCPNVKVKAVPVYTNTPGTGNMRAPVGVSSAFALETIVDEAAHKLGTNPFEFRMTNRAELYEGNRRFTSNGLVDCIRIGGEMIRWNENWRPQHGSQTNGDKKTGVGMAVASWHSRFAAGAATLRLETDGSLTVAAGVVDIGTGAKTALAIIAAKELGVSLSRIRVEWGDTDSCPEAVGESGSRTTSTMGSAVRGAAAKLRTAILDSAARMLHADAGSLTIADDQIRSVQDAGRALSLREFSAKLEKPLVVAERFEGDVRPDEHRASFAAHFCELEVDTDLGVVKVLRYVAVHDSGPIVNRLTSESQVQGGVIMGLGAALMEELIIERETGSVVNPSLINYRIPRCDQVPKIDVAFVETEDPYGPKSLGEVPIVPVSPCVGNAIFNATGVRLREIPMTPERLTAAIEEKSNPF